jgi:hypothetical protein
MTNSQRPVKDLRLSEGATLTPSVVGSRKSRRAMDRTLVANAHFQVPLPTQARQVQMDPRSECALVSPMQMHGTYFIPTEGISYRAC